MRYRIDNNSGQTWDTTDKRWRCLTDGRYNTYKSRAVAAAIARKIKAPMFWAASGQHIAEDISK